MTTKTKVLIAVIALCVVASTGVVFGDKFPTVEQSLKKFPAQVLRLNPDSPVIDPKDDTPAATPSQLAEGKAKMEKVQQALGSGKPQGKKTDIVRAEEIYPGNASPFIQKTESVDKHLSTDASLKDVTLCGTAYKSKGVTIDGIDVLQRLAAILPKTAPTPENTKGTLTLPETICENIVRNISMNVPYDQGNYSSIELPLSVEPFSYKGDQRYAVRIGTESFGISQSTWDIYGGYEPAIQIIGNLKK